jgi:hypothetical protein
VGEVEGSRVGSLDTGPVEGSEVGAPLGVVVGPWVGSFVGSLEVGMEEGSKVVAVGSSVAWVGSIVGGLFSIRKSVDERTAFVPSES